MKAAWADTDVILRHMSGEPADLAARAHAVMDQVEAGQLRLHISTEVICELVYVLGGKTYRYTPREIAHGLTALLTTPGVEPVEPELCLAALDRMAELNVPFVDALIAARALSAGEPVATFDERDFPRLGADLLPT